MAGELAKLQHMALREKGERDWSDLPSDIVGYIIGKLYFADRIRIRAVCKSWLRVSHHGIPTIDKDPWVMGFRWLRHSGVDGVKSYCLLTDYPVSETLYYVDRGNKGEDERALFVQAEFQSSRYGWVLFRKYQEENPSRCYCFFLYSPFTDEVIELPKLELNSAVDESFLVATFYLGWENSDCLVFCLHRDEAHVAGIIHISTCRPGYQTWKALEFQGSYSDYFTYNRPLAATYLDGSFYCVFQQGQLGAFNVALQEWTLLVKSWPSPLYCLCDGAELFSLPRCSGRPYERCQLLKFDFSEKRWVEALDATILSSSQATEEASETANINNFHLYAYLSLFDVDMWWDPSNIYPLDYILIEPPVKGVWRKRDLLQR